VAAFVRGRKKLLVFRLGVSVHARGKGTCEGRERGKMKENEYLQKEEGFAGNRIKREGEKRDNYVYYYLRMPSIVRED